jgi:hypothetical protein
MDAEDDNFATGINSCVHKGGQNSATANLPMGGYKHTGVADGSARNHYAAIGQVQDADFNYALAGGTADVITLTMTPAITAYSTGMYFVFKAASTNTSSVTVNVNSVGAKNVYRSGAALAAGDIVAGEIYIIAYDGTQFQLLGAGSAALACRAERSVSAQSIPDATLTSLEFNSEDYDYGGFHSTSADTQNFDAPVNGIYSIYGGVKFNGNGTGKRLIVVRYGSAILAANQLTVNDALDCYLGVSAQGYATAGGSSFTVAVYQDSGGALDAETGSSTCCCISLVRKVTI